MENTKKKQENLVICNYYIVEIVVKHLKIGIFFSLRFLHYLWIIIYMHDDAFILCPVLGSWFVHNRCRHRFYHISFFQFNSISHIHINVNMNTRFSLMQLNIMLFLYEMNVYNTDKYFYSKRMMQLAAFHFHGWNEIV